MLVADIVESTRLNASLGEERADEIRRIIFSRFDDAVAAHGGRMIKTMGDGCLVTFDGASEGVAAGIDMVGSIDRLARQVPGLQLRVGVAVGDVTEEDDDVFGPAVVVASRLCSAAAPGQLLASDVVRVLAGTRGSFEWERVGELFLKGIDEAVAASAARPPRSDSTRLRLPRPLRSRPGELFVGRSHLLDVLNRLWKEAATGEGRRAVVVAGEPGVGKTRLVAGQARRADEDGGLVLFGRCAEDLAVPYQPFADALRVSIDTAPRDLLAAHVAVHGGELRRLFPTMAAPDPVDAAPEAERLRLFDAVTDLLNRLAAEQPVVLVIDDIHWAAPATIQLLRHLISVDDPAPLLVMATYRDTEVDRHHPLATLLADIARLDGVERLNLVGLDHGEIEELVEAAAGDELDAGGLAMAAALFEHTAGNPFFAGQLLRHMAENGALVRRDGRWEATASFQGLPDGVIDVVNQRLNRLSTATNDVLSLAAVAGLSFTHQMLARSTSVEDVDAALDEAVAARLLTEDGRGGYVFVHAIVRDALLTGMTVIGRAKRHRDIAVGLRDLYGDNDAFVHDRAHHFCGAVLLGFAPDAAAASIAAANECVRRADMDAAVAVLERAWKAIDSVEPLDHEPRFTVLLRLAQLHYRLLDGVVDALVAAATSARSLHSPEKLVEVAYCSYRWNIAADDAYGLELIDDAFKWMPPGPSVTRAGAHAASAYLRNMQSQSGAREAAEEALRILAELGSPKDPAADAARKFAALALVGQPGAAKHLALLESFELDDGMVHEGFERAVYLASKAELYARLGDRKACDETVELLAVELKRTSEPTAGVYTRGWDVIRGFMDGDFDNQLERMSAGMPSAGVAVANMAAVFAAWSMWLAYEQGRSADILDGLRMLAAATGFIPSSTSPLAVHLTEVGLVDEARELVEQLVDQLPTTPRNAQFACIVALTATAAAAIGDPVFAQPLLDELDPYAGEVMNLPSVVILGAADRYRGLMLSLLGRHDEAIAALEAAVKLETKLGAPPLVKRTQYWLDWARAR